MKLEVVKRLRAAFGEQYDHANVGISATHTHAGPGGFSSYKLYRLISLGFDKRHFEAIVDGIVQSIRKAHENLTPGTISIAVGDVAGVSWNRSRPAYEQNGDAADYDTDTDRRMTLLKLVARDGTEIGAVNWLAVHGTSLSNQNQLISGDNKGLASYLLEKQKGARYADRCTFVAAFAQSNEGDVSPNEIHDGGIEATPPFERLERSGRLQFEKAMALYESASELLTGGIDYRHHYADFSSIEVEPRWTDGARQMTAPSGIGIGKLAGTEDGRGIGLPEGIAWKDILGTDFAKRLPELRARWLKDLPLWSLRRLWLRLKIRNLLLTEGQGEKPVFLPTGSKAPPWTPSILPLQLVTVGSLAILAVPFEMTTMAGRRLRAVVEARLRDAGIRHYVIAGLANAYGGYTTTKEEYDQQHYEGASTEFGPWQLDAIRQLFDELADSLRTGSELPETVIPPDALPRNLEIQPVLWDAIPPGKKLGSLRTDAATSYKPGDLVQVTFWGGHPKNSYMTQSTFCEVQREHNDGWLTVARDCDPEATYRWQRRFIASPFSTSIVEWRIPSDVAPGAYRIVHHGVGKTLFRGAKAYSGVSRVFIVG